MNEFLNFSIRQMFFAAVIAMLLAFVMLLYPGGVVALMAGAFWLVQFVLTLFIILHLASEIVRNSKAGSPWSRVASVILGLLAVAGVWFLDVRFVYFIIALFFVLTGVAEMAGAFGVSYGKLFIFLLGLINVIVGVFIIRDPLVLPLLIAWYILFWGVSRLALALNIRAWMRRCEA